MKIFVSKSKEETQKFGEEFVKGLNPNEARFSLKTGFNPDKATVIALYGELGSGKTTFVQGLARGLGIEKRIISPTFIIIRSYKVKSQKSKVKTTTQSSKLFYHIDLYRVQSMDDIKGLGIDEIINNTQNIVAIEWAEKMGKLLPKKRVDIYFEYVDENQRKITIKIDLITNS